MSKTSVQVRREGGVGGLATPGPATFGGAADGQKFIKYARMYHFEKKNSKKCFSRGAQ